MQVLFLILLIFMGCQDKEHPKTIAPVVKNTDAIKKELSKAQADFHDIQENISKNQTGLGDLKIFIDGKKDVARATEEDKEQANREFLKIMEDPHLLAEKEIQKIKADIKTNTSKIKDLNKKLN